MEGVQKKIELAYSFRDFLLGRRDILEKLAAALEKLKKTIIITKEESLGIGMVSICADCAKEGKTCCGAEIENKYSTELLTINLLLQVSLPKKPEIEGMCYFLSSRGCTLLARDVFCVNYICDRINRRLSPSMLKKLRDLEGEALEIQFELEKKLKRLFTESVREPFCAKLE